MAERALVSTSEVENRGPSTDTSDDPASSLRAAALLSRKSKRRNPPSDSTVSLPPQARPVPTDSSIQLDYGQDDIASSPPDVPMDPVNTPANSKPEVSFQDMEDGQLREEGEISESEGPNSTPPSPKRAAYPPRLSNRNDSPPRDTRPSTPPRLAYPKVESPTHNLLNRIGDPISEDPDVSFADTSLLVDADHVRPGLASSYKNLSCHWDY